MIRFKGYAIMTDGEYPVINTVTIAKSGKFKGQEILKPLYFPRDMDGAFKILYRISCTASCKECTSLEQVMEAIKQNKEDMAKSIKEYKKELDNEN